MKSTSLLSPTFPSSRSDEENGFTLVEVVVVIIIIGILAAIAIPIFLNQRRAAAVSQVTTDVHSAATEMFTVKANEDTFPARIPSSVVLSEGSRVVNSLAYSGPESFCITGTHETYEDIVVVFDSIGGGIVDPERGCSTAPEGEGGAAGGGETWQETLDDTIVLLVEDIRANNGSSSQLERKALMAAGIAEENIIYAPHVDTLEELKVYGQVDIVVSLGGAWSPSSKYVRFLGDAQAAGYSVFTDGNDALDSVMPFIETATLVRQEGSTYTPTNASVSPSFPYTFKETAFSNDITWRCVTELKETSVAVATHQTEDGQNCATAIADRNNGLWFHMTWARPEAADVAQAGILWLLG